jgi:hypothetical protein
LIFTMQAVRASAAEEEVTAQAQLVREDQAAAEAEVKREVAEEATSAEKDVAVVGEDHVEAEAEAEAQAEEEVEAEAGPSAKKNRIQVSTNKKPLYFYVNLAKARTKLITSLRRSV